MYLIFAYDGHEPEGAPYDFVCQYKTFKECIDEVIKSTFDTTCIYDVLNDDWYIFQEATETIDGAVYDRGLKFKKSGDKDEDEKWVLLTKKVIDELSAKLDG